MRRKKKIKTTEEKEEAMSFVTGHLLLVIKVDCLYYLSPLHPVLLFSQTIRKARLRVIRPAFGRFLRR